jgi:hypothetical protein
MHAVRGQLKDLEEPVVPELLLTSGSDRYVVPPLLFSQQRRNFVVVPDGS